MVVAGATPDVVGIRVAWVEAVEGNTSETGSVVIAGVFVDAVDVDELYHDHDVAGGTCEKLGWEVFTTAKVAKSIAVSHCHVEQSHLLPVVDETAATTAGWWIHLLAMSVAVALKSDGIFVFQKAADSMLYTREEYISGCWRKHAAVEISGAEVGHAA